MKYSMYNTPDPTEDMPWRMVTTHKKYEFRNDVEVDRTYFSAWTDELNNIVKNEGAVLYLPVYMMDHSGITLSTVPFGGDHGNFDSGQIGYIFATREEILETYDVKRLSLSTKVLVLEDLNRIINLYTIFLEGAVEIDIMNNDGEIITTRSFGSEDEALTYYKEVWDESK